jgi:hypothetical protein
MVEMNWFLLTFPVTILYESTGIPKRLSALPDADSADEEEPDVAEVSVIAMPHAAAESVAGAALPDASEVPDAEAVTETLSECVALSGFSAVFDLVQASAVISMTAMSASPVTGILI